MQTRKRLGILVNNLENCELSFYINRFAYLYMDELDILVFTEEKSPPCIPPTFAVMSSNEVYCYNAPIVATNLTTAKKLLTIPTGSKKYYYLNGLHWMLVKPDLKDYSGLSKIYHGELELIVRNEIHKKLVERAWNTKCNHVADNFDLFSNETLKAELLNQDERQRFLV